MATAYHAHYNGRTVTVTESDKHPGRPYAVVNRFGRTVYLRADWVEIIGDATDEETTAAEEAEATHTSYARQHANDAWDNGDHITLAEAIHDRARVLFGTRPTTNALLVADEMIHRGITSLPAYPGSLLNEVDQIIRQHTTALQEA
ncbi:MAG: hypothetical protein ACTH2Y_08465 [Corynebacterium sp.]|uniref:hypothetical protein n=1 Tax=Corynebacterium sp. TaxID=1720 RepID=UPI003F8FA145